MPRTDKHESYWQVSAETTNYPKLTEDIHVDVAIAGGGITGLTIAYLLKESGLKVAVLEKNRIGSGTTNKTTGKVTSQHNKMYADLLKSRGERYARIYAQANQDALGEIRDLIKRNKIDCDWNMRDNYVYTSSPEQISKFEEEADIAKRLGLPASFDNTLDLPFRICAAVKFTDQAYFNAQKYVNALANMIHGGGSFVFENSNVDNFQDGAPATLKSCSHTVTARDVVVATKVPAAPLIARGTCAAFEYPHTSYIVAGEYAGSLKGMYISPDKEHYSILPVKDGARQLLFIGGGKHIPGLRIPSTRYKKLAAYAKEHFGVSSIEYEWKGMDYLPYDNVPLIGKLYPWSKHTYVATGFKKWGLTTSMVAAIILRDAINGNEHPWAKTFDSLRLKPVTSIPKQILKSIKG